MATQTKNDNQLRTSPIEAKKCQEVQVRWCLHVFAVRCQLGGLSLRSKNRSIKSFGTSLVLICKVSLHHSVSVKNVARLGPPEEATKPSMSCFHDTVWDPLFCCITLWCVSHSLAQ